MKKEARKEAGRVEEESVLVLGKLLVRDLPTPSQSHHLDAHTPHTYTHTASHASGASLPWGAAVVVRRGFRFARPSLARPTPSAEPSDYAAMNSAAALSHGTTALPPTPHARTQAELAEARVQG